MESAAAAAFSMLVKTTLAVLFLVAFVSVTAPTPAAAQPAPVRLAFLGDSLTLGLHASADERMYREILARRILGRNGGTTVATVVQHPFGMTDDAINRMGPVLDSRPDVIILEIGNHEVFAGPEQIELFPARYDTLLAYLQGTGATVIAGTVAWLNYPITSREYSHSLRVNALIRELCARRGIAVADLWSATVFRPEYISVPEQPSVIQPFEGDYLHPNDAGHQALADAFWDAYRRDLARRALEALR